VLCYETISETEWASSAGADTFIPTTFIDISSYLEEKIRAMSCYQTQLKPFPETRSLQALQALARWRGATVGVEAAEAFTLIREIVS
jgi:LmbE family N-acetylglucosaminyl deacetylase